MRFRIIPYYQDDLTTITKVKDQNDWNAIVNDVKVKTADIVANNAPTLNQQDLSQMPKLVTTNHDWILDATNNKTPLSISGNSRTLTITGYETSAISNDLNSANTNHLGYSTQIELGFRVNDGSLPANIYFKRSDFVNWLKGDGSTPSALKVYDAANNVMIPLNTVGVPLNSQGQPTGTNNDKYIKPVWNKIDMDSFKARFISVDSKYRASDSTEVSLVTHSTVNGTDTYTTKKWTDLKAYLDRLKNLSITGTTKALSTQDLTAIQSDLDKDFGVVNGFKIQSTPVVTSGVADWTSTKVKDAALPDEINLIYDLGFRIIPVSGGFVASIEPAAGTALKTNPDVIWNKNSSTQIKKYLHLDAAKDLASIGFSGNTKSLTLNGGMIPSNVISADLNGQMMSGPTATFKGAHVLAWIKPSTGSKHSLKGFDNPVELTQFIQNLSNTNNKDIFDGTWGRDDIQLKYSVDNDYAADQAELDATIQPSGQAIANVKRYINIDSLLLQAGVSVGSSQATGNIAVITKNANEGWWKPSASDYSDKKSWAGYADNKDFNLSDITIPSNLHVKIQYKTDTDTNFTDAKPTTLNDNANMRTLSIRFVSNGNNYGTEEFETSDMTTGLPNSHDITNGSKVRSLPTRIDVSGVHLDKIKFIGNTRDFNEDLSQAGIPTNANVEYSITNFTTLNSSNATLAAAAQAELAKIGITNSAFAALYNQYTGSFTISQLKLFINAIVSTNSPALKEIIRSSISARLVPKSGYSITQTDDTNTRKSIDVSSLYTFKDITSMVSYLKLASPAGAQTAINIYGAQGKNEKALVRIPDALITALNNAGLKLQYTKSGEKSGQTTIITSTPVWQDVNAVHFAAANGAPEMDHGFEVELETLGSNAAGKPISYLAFRIVPTENDLGAATTAAAGDSLNDHYDKTKTKLYTVSGTGINAVSTEQLAKYEVDTSHIPAVINVSTLQLSSITASGNTKEVDIVEHIKSGIDALNPKDHTLDDKLQLLYALDKTDGQPITAASEKTANNLLWLTEPDFEAYWHGNLVVSGNKVVYKLANGSTEEVEAFTPAIITARNLKDGDKVVPDYYRATLYEATNNLLFVKWVAMSKDYVANPDYVPSNANVESVSYNTTSFKKWYNGATFNAAVQETEVSGTTKNYNLNFAGNAAILNGIAIGHKLKLQYSTDSVTWSDSKIDFNSAPWATKVSRKIYIRVVPQNYHGTTAVTGPNAVISDDTDGVVVDYRTDQKAGELTKYDEVDQLTNEKKFKTHLDISNTELNAIKAEGNSWSLISTSLDESAIDTNSEKYSQVEIQYKFNNKWYTRANLLQEMAKIRTDITDTDKAGAYVAPSDFTHDQIEARWRVLDPVNYIIEGEQTEGTNRVSNNANIDTSSFKTFINVWNIQDKFTNDFTAKLGTQDKLFDLAAASTATSFTLSGGFAVPAPVAGVTPPYPLPASVFDGLNVKLQYSVAETPDDSLTASQWHDAEFQKVGGAAYPAILKDVPYGANKNGKLWFRLVPKDSTKYVVSTTQNDGNSTNVTHIKMDTSHLKYTITVDPNALKKIKISGDTQNLFNADQDPFLKARDENGTGTVDGIAIYVTDGNNQKIQNPNANQVQTWLNNMHTTIRYRVTPNRTDGKYVAGTPVEFASLDDLKKELGWIDPSKPAPTTPTTPSLNFDRDTLQVSWGFLDGAFLPSDSTWITPDDVKGVKNIIYTEDIFKLDKTAFSVTGNNLKVQAPVIVNIQDPWQLDKNNKFKGTVKKYSVQVLDPTNLQKLHVKLQYNKTKDSSTNGPDANQWMDVPPTDLDGEMNYWIRYEVLNTTDAEIRSISDPNNPHQVIKLNVDNIKQAIPFNYNLLSDIKAQIAAAALKGTTIDFNWDGSKKIPDVALSLDNKKHGKIQYSIDGKTYSDTIAEALSTSDYYGSNVLGFIKDRGDKLYVRYVYEETIGNAAAMPSQKYVFTNRTGDEIQLIDLLGTISIDNLDEPIWIDSTLGKLSNQFHITQSGLTAPNGGTEFATTSWRELAEYGLFKPSFVPSKTDGKADFQYMWYDGVIKENKDYIFGLGKNPFFPTNPLATENDYSDPKAADYRTDLRALLPRHTHLEYATMSGSSWGSWSETPPKDIAKNSNAKTFKVRLVADDGYILGDTDANGDITDFVIDADFMDGSVRTAKTVKSSAWSKEYNVTVELLTSAFHLPADAADQATFIGWNEDSTDPINKPGKGTFATTNADGNHLPSNDANNLKNILVHYQGANDVALDFENSERGFVIEWNVLDSNGNEIEWTDSKGVKAKGFHLSAPANTNAQAPAPDSSVPWYGYYPTSLKNGDIIQSRLRARDGFVISKDTHASDYNINTKESNYSHIITFSAVNTLTDRITIPANFAFYNQITKPDGSVQAWDFLGNSITVDSSMPTIAYSGSQGMGKVTIAGGPSNINYHYEVAVLRAITDLSGMQSPFDNNQKPMYGYCIETREEQLLTKQQTLIFDAKKGWRSGWKTLLESKSMWKDPATVNDLSVGDVVLVRLVANQGYGFEWEDPSKAFQDINYPKEKTYNFYGTNVDSLTANDASNLYGVNAEQVDPNAHLYPSIVRGLKIVPTIDVNTLDL